MHAHRRWGRVLIVTWTLVLLLFTGIGMALRMHDMHRAAKELLRWDKAGNPPRPLAGLTRRRKAERALFLKENK